jgi:hypothetical protein
MMTHEEGAPEQPHYAPQCLPIHSECRFPTRAMSNWRSRLLGYLARPPKNPPAHPELVKRALRGIDALVRIHEELDGCGCFYYARQARIRDAARWEKRREAERRA